MNLYIYCFFVSTINFWVMSSPRSKFMSIRKRKCLFGGDSSKPWQTRRQNHVIDFNLIKKYQQNIPDTKIGPPLHKGYDPTQGYEPYWEEGSWMLVDDINKAVKEEEAKAATAGGGAGEEGGDGGGGGPDVVEEEDKMCDTVCPNMFKLYGPICAIDKNSEYVDFKSYCAMKNDDCGDTKGLMIAHRGKCFELITQNTIVSELLENAAKYLKEFEEKYSKEIK